MRRILTMIIEDGNKASKEVNAFSKDSATVFIKAQTLQEALPLLEEGMEEAGKLCTIWEPTEQEQEQEEKPQKHYALKRVAQEDIQEYLEEYAATTKGRNFIKSLEKAKTFRQKRDCGGLVVSQFNYLLMLTEKNTFDGLLAMYDLSYRRGYNKAVKDIKG